MSIPAAVTELNKEIAALDKIITDTEKKKARVVTVRDSLLTETGTGVPATKGKRGRKPGSAKKAATAKEASGKKSAVAAKPATLKKTAAKKKRTVSPEGKKRMAEAQKKRWAAQRAAAKAE